MIDYQAGEVLCDRCGAGLGNGSAQDSSTLIVLDTDGNLATVNWGTRCCLKDILTQDTIAARPTPLVLFDPEPRQEDPAEPEVPAATDQPAEEEDPEAVPVMAMEQED